MYIIEAWKQAKDGESIRIDGLTFEIVKVESELLGDVISKLISEEFLLKETWEVVEVGEKG